MPTSLDPQPSQQTQAGGETFREQPQWCSPQPHSHCPAAASFSGQSQLCQVPYAGELGASHRTPSRILSGGCHRQFPQAVPWCSSSFQAWFLCLIVGSTHKGRGLESSSDFKSPATQLWG